MPIFHRQAARPQETGMEHSRTELSAVQAVSRYAALDGDGANVVRNILDLARWAPSGDNTQPWRFEIVSPSHVVVHGFDTRDHCVYDLDGRPSRLSIGAMLETLRIAATRYGIAARWALRDGCPEPLPSIDVRLDPDPPVTVDPLVDSITTRCVNRRPLSTAPLTPDQRDALEGSVGTEHEVVWFADSPDRRRLAGLMFRSAHLRLTIEEAYRVHSAVIEWGASTSADRIPDEALGLDPVSLRLMKWVMANWPRARFVSRWLGGTLLPRVQLDWLPGIRCAAHVLIVSRSGRTGVEEDFRAGAAIQRFWLTADRLGLQHQPEMTPLIFSRYSDHGLPFSTDPTAAPAAAAVQERLASIVGKDRMARAVWLGRIGAGDRAQARSVRLPLDDLLVC